MNLKNLILNNEKYLKIFKTDFDLFELCLLDIFT